MDDKNAIDAPGRLHAVHRLGLIGTPPEPEFDELVELAAAICEVPISLLSFIDDKRQWYKAAIGMCEPELPLERTFCQYTIRQDNLLLVEDTTQDELFVNHPSVVGDPSVRFYAGISIMTTDGYPVGTICVADFIPRQMSPTQIQTLKVLARQANARIELREQRLTLERALADAEQAKDRLAASEARFKIFMDSAPFMSFLKDEDGRFLFYSRSVADRYGISREEWIGKTIMDIVPAAEGEAFHRHDMEVLASRVMDITDETVSLPDGQVVQLRLYTFACNDGDKLLLGGISVDVTDDIKLQAEIHRYQVDLEEANSKLLALATTDSLTGLANRRAIDDRLTAEFSQARRKHRNLCVVMLDVDDFKRVNDEHGHEEGDNCLKQVAALLSSLLRENDMIGRYGGEEFVILLPETDKGEASRFGEKILDTMRSAPWSCTPMTVSGGIACMDSTTSDSRQLISLADEALYAAKYAGKDRLFLASDLYEKVS